MNKNVVVKCSVEGELATVRNLRALAQQHLAGVQKDPALSTSEVNQSQGPGFVYLLKMAKAFLFNGIPQRPVADVINFF